MIVTGKNRSSAEELYLRLLEQEKRSCEKSYYEFFRAAWHTVEAKPLIDNWHIKYLCDILQKEVDRIAAGIKKPGDIIINIAPRSLKSRICTVLLCPWVWGPRNLPWFKFINNSHSKDLSIGHCLESRMVIQSDWYQGYWGNRFKLTTDQNTKGWFKNDHHGERKTTSTGANIYGLGADFLTNDDPQDPEKAESDVERETVKRHWGQTLYSRLNEPKISLRLIIQQRLHEDDLTGHCVSNDPKEYRHICIPVEITEDIKPQSIKKYYKEGLFFPSRFDWDFIETTKLPTNMGAGGYARQYLQAPQPPEGGLFKRVWWRFWTYKGQAVPPVAYKDETGTLKQARIIELPDRFDAVVDSWDTALDGESYSDDVDGAKWAKKGPNKFLLEPNEHGKMDYPATKRGVDKLWKSDERTSSILIEKSSNGPAVAKDLQDLPIILVPTGPKSKEDRVRLSDTVPYVAQVEAGNIYLPHPSICPWVNDFVEEHALFPKSSQDARVDTSSQAVNHLTSVVYTWPYFQPEDHVSDFKVERVFSGSYYHYGACYLSKSMKLSVLSTVWSRADHKLYVYGNLITRQVSVEEIAVMLVRGMKLNARTCQGLLGNLEMFSVGHWARSLSVLLNEELAKRGSKTVVRQPHMYNREGSLGLANLMYRRNLITVHQVCRPCIQQFAGLYASKKDKPPEIDGFELAECLSMIISEINRDERILKEKKPIDGYRPATPDGKIIRKENKAQTWESA